LYQIALPTEAFEETLKQFEAKKWLVKTDTHVILTRDGRLMADYIASELFV
jgi:coproporphyrinogen III oxidase-like Fe-S oxidoreductase